MSNSRLISYTKLSPNHSGKRTHLIDRISPHCVVGQLTAEEIANLSMFTQRDEKNGASCNYAIGSDGKIALVVDESNRSWCTSSRENDQRAVTIECASDKATPYAFRDNVYSKLVELCTDICKRNGKSKLLWFGDKNKTLNYEPKADEMVITVHRWFANKACPGDWLYNRLGDLAEKVTAQLNGGTVPGLQATELKSLSEADVIAKVGPLFTADQKKSGILASVSLAQFILECGYGKTELAQNANNCFGMKKVLSGNTWSGSTWDGKSVYRKKTQEQKPDGTEYTVTADFRKYSCIEDSIADHSAYLLGAKNGEKLRYEGLKNETDYKKAIQIIKDGGYATDVQYVQKICNIIERWDLSKYNADQAAVEPETEQPWYRVRRSWAEANTQKGAYHNLDLAKKCADEISGYKVYDENGKCIYEPKTGASVPFTVKVDIPDLRIRKGPGTNYGKTGLYTGKGIFTIVEVASGVGSDAGWGLLKSYQKNRDGWIALDHATKI